MLFLYTNTNTYTYTYTTPTPAPTPTPTRARDCKNALNMELWAPRASMLPTRYLHSGQVWGLVVPENVNAQFPSALPIRPGSRQWSQDRYQYWAHLWGLVVPESVQAQFPSKISGSPGSRRRSKDRYQYWVHFWGPAVPESVQAQFPSTISMQTFPAFQNFPGELSRYFKISLAIPVAYPCQNPQIPGHLHGIFFILCYAICDMCR